MDIKLRNGQDSGLRCFVSHFHFLSLDLFSYWFFETIFVAALLAAVFLRGVGVVGHSKKNIRRDKERGAERPSSASIIEHDGDTIVP